MKLSTLAICLLSAACIHNIHAQTAAFPAAIATDANLKVGVNGVSTLLTGALNTSATTLAVSSCSGIVANILITIGSEIMPVSGCTGTVLVVGSRGFDGTTAATHAASTPIYAYVDAWHHNSLKAEVEAIETTLGVNLANAVTAGTCPSGQSVTAIHTGSSPTCSPVVGTFNTRSGAVTLTAADVTAAVQALLTTSSPTFSELHLTGDGSTYALIVEQNAAASAATFNCFDLGADTCFQVAASGTGRSIAVSTAGTLGARFIDGTGICDITTLAGLVCDAGNPIRSVNYIGSETGANNAIAGTLPYAVSISANPPLVVQILLGHSLQAGANTFNYAGGGALAIKSCRNPSNNIATAYVSGGLVTLAYNTGASVWCDVSQ